MARARELSDLDCEASFAEAAVRAVEVRADEVFEHAEGVLDTGDIERVHDMRVATRRLRAAMEVFESCFPRKRLRKALRDVKALADALGERRDRDVEIEFLLSFAAETHEADREAVAALVEGARAEQREANERLVEFVDRERLEKLRRRLGKLGTVASR